jgi:hypothetical protein
MIMHLVIVAKISVEHDFSSKLLNLPSHEMASPLPIVLGALPSLPLLFSLPIRFSCGGLIMLPNSSPPDHNQALHVEVNCFKN